MFRRQSLLLRPWCRHRHRHRYCHRLLHRHCRPIPALGPNNRTPNRPVPIRTRTCYPSRSSPNPRRFRPTPPLSPHSSWRENDSTPTPPPRKRAESTWTCRSIRRIRSRCTSTRCPPRGRPIPRRRCIGKSRNEIWSVRRNRRSRRNRTTPDTNPSRCRRSPPRPTVACRRPRTPFGTPHLRSKRIPCRIPNRSARTTWIPRSLRRRRIVAIRRRRRSRTIHRTRRRS
mmetsp:Transcript_33238/g.98806  ORF Transcript_33238/g.98806 Transcript_33238/m.98806 type:complete len:228 (-) Transcript_33238:1286-1969(-)